MRATAATIDLSAIERNVESLVALVSPSEFCAVVKADAYGHGAVQVSRAALAGGASRLAVALVDEGIELRNAGITCPILILSQPRPHEMLEVISYDLTPTLYSLEGITSLEVAIRSSGTNGEEPIFAANGEHYKDQTLETAAAAEGAGAGVSDNPKQLFPVHLNLDSGMNRVGFRDPDVDCGLDSNSCGGLSLCCSPVGLDELVTVIENSPRIQLEGVLTHFACADELDNDFTDQQLAHFQSSCERLREMVGQTRYDELVIHVANSAALLSRPDCHKNMVRCGIAIYGVSPAAEPDKFELPIKLEPALTLKARISSVKVVRVGETVSYGRRFKADDYTAIATIPIGYADGIRRDSATHGVEVLIGSHRCPIVGSVTMDQTMVDISAVVHAGTHVGVGDEVVFIGRQGPHQITATEIAQRLDTIAYEILCAISSRVIREYQ